MLRLTGIDYNSADHKRTVVQGLRAQLLIQKPLVINAFTDVTAVPTNPLNNNNLQMALKKPEDFKKKEVKTGLRQRLFPLTAGVSLSDDDGVSQERIENRADIKEKFADTNRRGSLLEAFGDLLRTKNLVAIKDFIGNQDPNLKGSFDKTSFHSVSLLHRVSLRGTPQSVTWIQQLLARGADIEAKDYRGWTPIHFAIATFNEPALQYYHDQNLVKSELVHFAQCYPKAARLLSGITQAYVPLSNTLPTIIIKISENHLAIVRQTTEGQESVLYQGPYPCATQGSDTRTLEQEDFSFYLDETGTLDLGIKNKAVNLKILSKKPLVLAKKCEILGTLSIKAPHTKNLQTITASEIVVKGTLVNRGTLLADQLLLARKGGHACEITLDNEQGKIMTRGVRGKLFIDHGAVNNQQGLLQAQQSQMLVNAIDNRQGTMVTVEKAVIISTGPIQNQKGWIVSKEKDLRVESQQGAITCINGGVLTAFKGALRVETDTLRVDESSLVGGQCDTQINAQNHAHFESILSSKSLSLSAGVLDVACGLYSDQSIRLYQSQSNHLLSNQPIRCGDSLDINTTHTLKGNLSFHWPEGRTIKEPLNVMGGLSYTLTKGAQRPLWFLADQKAGPYFKVHTPTALIVGDERPEGYVQLSASGHVHLQTQGAIPHTDRATKQAHDVGILVQQGKIEGGKSAYLKSEADISLGTLDISTIHGPIKPSVLSSPGLVKCETPWHTQWHQMEIRAEGLQVHAGYGYELALLSPGIVLKKGTIYVEKQDQVLKCTVLDTAGTRVSDTISTEDLPVLAGKLGEPLDLETLKPLLSDLVRILSDRGYMPVALDDVSSYVVIQQDLDLDVPLSQHRLLVEEKANGQQVPWQGGSKDYHESHRIIGPSAQALSLRADLRVKGVFRPSGVTKLFGSQIQCGVFKEGALLPEKTTFVPFTSHANRELCGHRKRKHARWYGDMQTFTETPLASIFSVAGVIDTESPTLRIDGFLSAFAINVSGLYRGWIGLPLDFKLRLASPEPFKQNLQLADYCRPTACFEMQSGGDTVYKSLSPWAMLRPRVDPAIVLNPDGTLGRPEPGIRFLLTLEQEEEALGSGLMKELKRAFLDETLYEPEQMLPRLKQHAAEQMLRENRDSQALVLRRADPRSIAEPIFYYYKVPLHNKDGVFLENVYLPGVGLPKRFDNPRLRDGAGGALALAGPLSFRGVEGATLTITAHLEGESVAFRHMNQVSHLRRTVQERVKVVTEIRTSRLIGPDKVSTHEEEVILTHLEPGDTIVTSPEGGVTYDEVDTVLMSGLRTDIGRGGYRIRGARQVIDAAIVRTVIGPTQTDRQRGLLGLGGTEITAPSVRQEAIGSQINSIGPVHIETELGIFEATQFGLSPATLQVTELHYHELLRAMEAHDRTVAETIRQAERTRKRKKRQGIVWLLISLPVSAYVGGLVTGWLQGAMGLSTTATTATAGATAATGAGTTATIATTASATTTAVASTVGATAAASTAAVKLTFTQALMLGMTKSAVMGATSAFIRRAPVLRGFAEGMALGALDIGVNHVLGASAEDLLAQALEASITATLQTVLHKGNFAENILIAVAANTVANAAVPMGKKQLSGLGLSQMALRSGKHAGVSAVTAAVLNASPDFITNIAIAAVGGVIGPIAQSSGQAIGEELAARPAQAAVFKEQLAYLSHHAAEALKAEGIPLDAHTIQESLEQHPALQGSPAAAKRRLIGIGQRATGQGVIKSSGEYLVQGLACVLESNLNMLVLCAHALEESQEASVTLRLVGGSGSRGSSPRYTQNSVLNGKTRSGPIYSLADTRKRDVVFNKAHGMKATSSETSEMMLPMYHRDRDAQLNTPIPSSSKPFRLDSVLPDSDPNPFLNYTYALGRGIERGRDSITDAVLHPIDTAIGLGVAVWDGYNALSDLAFGLSTQGSRVRNDMRGHAVVNGYEQFIQADGAKKLEIASMFVTTSILGAATTAAATCAPAVASKGLTWTYQSAKNRGIIKTVNPSAINFSQSSINGLQEITAKMSKGGWNLKEGPIDVVRMRDGSLVTLDNTRILAATQAGIKAKAIIRNYNDPLPKNMIKRLTTRKDGAPSTWGEATQFRINKQKRTYRDTYPNGSQFIGVGSKK